MDYANNKKSLQNEYISKKSYGFSFYQKIFFLYFLNLVDWFCTQALLSSGRFYEANPIMQPVLGSFWSALLVKGILPLVLIIICSVVYKLMDVEEGFSQTFCSISESALMHSSISGIFSILYCSF